MTSPIHGRRSPTRLGGMIALVLALLGCTLLASQLIGAVHNMGSLSFGAAGGLLQPGQANVAPSAGLAAYLRQVRASGTCDLLEATQRVYLGTRHTSGRHIHWSENWLHYLLGKVYRPFARTQSVERLVAGREGDCSERAAILKAIVEASGHSCRFVGLNGHVVLEVQVDDQWWTSDPDYGVVYPFAAEQLAETAREAIVRSTLAVHAYPADTVSRYIDILQSTHDNVVLPTGMPLSPRLFVVENACAWLAWLLPAACCLLAGWLKWN